MSAGAFPQRAWYDENGDIVLNGLHRIDPEPQPLPQPVYRKRQFVEEEKTSPLIKEDVQVEWIIIDDNPPDLHPVEEPDLPDDVAETRGRRLGPTMNVAPGIPWGTVARERIVAVRQMTREAVREGAQQYAVTFRTGAPLAHLALLDARNFFRMVRDVLTQPVWVPTRKKQIKQYKRGTLFLLDILRFGGTFVAIFVVLFLALNYRSFWEIARSDVEVFLQSPSVDAPGASNNSPLIETLKAQAQLTAQGRERGELLSYLPTVGPPENRVIVPKLGLNIPLVQPKIDALLKQDWAQVETDIQEALQGGVVHYPGTARPGQAGNFFVTGHSSYYPWAPGNYKNVFARLHELNPGDEYWVYYKGDRHRYVVVSEREVLPTDVTVLDQPENERLSTLMTCTPIGTTLRRLIILAREVDPLTGEPLKVGERAEKGVTPAPKLESLPI